MPPKRQHSVSSIDINTVSTAKFRSNAASDLVTKSEAALSSQASVFQKTNGSQASQYSNFNYAINQHEDMQFNRQEMAEVRITKEEEEVIQKILELSRKGKVNSKNAFEIPIKVVNSESSFSVNNKFWKFASELLSASMSIYDKRVENMYLSAGAFENKLSRIGFDIKNTKHGENHEQRHDDVHADEESRARKNREERQNILKISVQDFSGSLDLEDDSLLESSTLEKKDKLSIKNMENEFIIDHTFQRTQKMFDSFSLKSLMLNIFELSSDLDVRIFIKSDLEWQKLKKEERDRTQANIESQKPQMQPKYDTAPLSYELQKHIEVSKEILEKNLFLGEIQNFLVKQPEEGQFSQLFKEFEESYDQDIGGHHFQGIQEGDGLYETDHISQSQNFSNSHGLNFSEHVFNPSGADQFSEANSMPVSFHENFYGWDEKNNIIEPIMPWEIEFRNLELTKKRKKGSKNEKKENKKNSKKSQMPIAVFDFSIMDRKQILKNKEVKSKFQVQKFKLNYKQSKTVGKEFDILHSQYHVKLSQQFINSRNSVIKLSNKFHEDKERAPGGIETAQNFILDFGQTIEPSFGEKMKLNQNQDEETKFLESQNYPQNYESQNIFEGEKLTKNTSYAGVQMGVNNIREIKKIIVDEVNEKGRATLERMNRMLVNLSPQQMFTIFLHLTNEHHFEIRNEDSDESTIVLQLAERRRNNRNGENNGYEDVEI